MSLLADTIEAQSQTLIACWLEELRQGLAPSDQTTVELRDHVSDVLRELVQALRRGDAPDTSRAAREHGKQRHRVGFDLQQLVREYGILRNVVLRAAHHAQRAISCAEVEVLTDYFSTAVAAGVAEHGRQAAQFERLLLGIVSHDLRAPLSAILLGTQTILRRDGLDERSTRTLVRMQSSADRAARTVRDLLDLTQARLGLGIPLQPSVANLHQIIRSVAAELEATHPERTLKLELSGDGQGVWDADRLRQVVANLIGNALEHSPADSIVQVRCADRPDGVALEVHNDGPAIAAEALPRLFEPRQRATGLVDRRERGVGLGLFIVKQLLDAHGGQLDVDSSAGRGTTFRFVLPRAVSASVDSLCRSR